MRISRRHIRPPLLHSRAMKSSPAPLPDPNCFSHLTRLIPHYSSHQWRGILKNERFAQALTQAQNGASVVSDMDHTVYFADAGFALLDAAVATGLLHGANLRRYQDLWSAYGRLPQNRSVNEKARDEYRFFCDILTTVGGLALSDLEELSRKVWFAGVAGKKALVHTIYPEVAYFFAVTRGGAKNPRHGVVGVTASPDFAIAPALELFSIEPGYLRAMLLEVDGAGKLTGRLSKTIYGPSKVTAAQEIFPQWDYAFGDNPLNDGPFMAAAKRAAFGIGGRMKSLDGQAIATASPRQFEYLDLCLPPVNY